MNSNTPIRESALIHTHIRQEKHIRTTYRMIKNFLSAENRDAFSFFLTTDCENRTEEDFLFDLTEKETVAYAFFEILCQKNVTACTLFEIAEDFFGQTEKMDEPNPHVRNILQ